MNPITGHTHYHNEFNPESAAMLRQFMLDGIIPKGHVDERSITEVSPDDLRGYKQCHFFAGIGGWAIALGLAGWPEDRECWTGSCPCQPFSSAGGQKGKSDDRHLWPVWERLISQFRPATVFGEQVASAVSHGWLDDVYEGLEPQGYAVGSAVLPACSVGAPHKRDRLWFVAHAKKSECEQPLARTERESGSRSSNNGYVGDTTILRMEGCGTESDTQRWKTKERHADVSSGTVWAGSSWARCADGKQRSIEPSIPLLADGFQHRRPIIHAIGNAIVPQLACEFIKASM